MAREKGPLGVHIVTCDCGQEDCTEKYVSYSNANAIRGQVKHLGGRVRREQQLATRGGNLVHGARPIAGRAHPGEGRWEVTCSKCSGALLPEWGAFRNCPTCREKDAAGHRSEAGRDRDARYREAHGDRLRADRAEDMAGRYREAEQSKQCVDGCGSPVGRFKRCAACRRKRAAWNRNYRERLRAAEARS